MNKIAYVYAINVNGTRRIIGKGSNGRKDDYLAAMRAFDRGTRKPRGVIGRKLYAEYRRGAKITSEILVGGLTHTQAFKREAVMIAAHNARFPGQLWNIMPGGAGFNPSDYTPEALAEIKALASKASRKFWDSASRKTRARIRANQSAGLKDFYSDPERRAAFRDAQRKLFAKLRQDPAWLANKCAIAKRVQNDPLLRKRKSKILKRLFRSNPDLCARRGELLSLALADPALRKKWSETRKLWFRNPENRVKHKKVLAAAMKPEVRRRAGATLSNTLRNDPKVRANHLAMIDRIAADKDLQRRKGIKLSRTLRDNPDVLKNRTAAFMRTFNTADYQRGFRARLKAVHNDPAIQRRRLASVRRALKDPAKEARRKAGLARYWNKVRAGILPHPSKGKSK